MSTEQKKMSEFSELENAWGAGFFSLGAKNIENPLVDGREESHCFIYFTLEVINTGRKIIMDLKKRCKDYLTEFETLVRRFCARLGISYSAYYQWQRDELRLADSTLKRIDTYLSHYGF